MYIITGINYSTGEVTISPSISLTSKKENKLHSCKRWELRQVVPKEHLNDLKIGQVIKISISI